MANNRIFYACQALAIAKSGYATGDPEFVVMPGVQSVGISTNFSLDPVFEYGQLEPYSVEEDLATVEVTIEKVIDGEKLLYLQAVGNAGSTSVASAANSKCDVYLGIFPDTTVATDGASQDEVVYCSGMQVSSVGYNYSVDGNATESLTVIGNNKFWSNSTYGYIGTTPDVLFGTDGGTTNQMSGTDTPRSGIVRRAQFDYANSTLPDEVTAQVHNFGGSNGLQSVSVNVDFGRSDQLELGRFGPYNQTAEFPIEVTSEFEVTATKGDLISISGVDRQASNPNRTILIKDTAGTILDLGTKNKLSSVSQNGGDTGGGNMTITYSYTNYNKLVVDGGLGPYWS